MDELALEEDTVFVGTQEALASQLGVERKTIARWQKMTDCPGRGKNGYSLPDWKGFVERNNLGRRKTKSKTDLDNEKIALGNERMRLVNAKLRGEVLGQDEVIKTMSDVIQGFALQLTQMKHTLAEEVIGLPQGEVVKRIERRIKEVLGEIALGSWAEKKTFWSKVSAALSDLHRTLGHGRGVRTM